EIAPSRIPLMGKKAWWTEGVRFQCQGSGKCCVSHGEFGYVYLTLADRRRMAKHLNLSVAEFVRVHCDRDDEFYVLKETGEACRFLDQNRCGVYEGRPTQCRTWPFWPEEMSPKQWKKEVASFCPGVGKGKTWTEEEIREVREEHDRFEAHLQ